MPTGRYVRVRAERRVRIPLALALPALVLGLLSLVLAGCGGHRAASATRPSPTGDTAAGPRGGPAGLHPPAQFAPAAVSFVDADLGFAFGAAPCVANGTTLCPALLRTADAGRSWSALVPPPLLVLGDPQHHPLLQFADALDGFATDGRPGSPLAVTHDGGRTWALRTLPLATATTTVGALASDDGRVVLVAGDATGERLYISPASRDTFTDSGLALPGTPATVTLALADGSGWVTASDAGAAPVYARTDDDVAWHIAALPCVNGQNAAIAAADALRVYALCEGAVRGGAAPRTAYASGDGGRTFALVGHVGGEGRLTGFAAAGSKVLALATSAAADDLLRSPDAGHTVVLTYSSSVGGLGQGLFDLAFTDATHGCVVLGSTGAYARLLAAGGKDVPTTRLLLTQDGGAHWAQAIFAP